MNYTSRTEPCNVRRKEQVRKIVVTKSKKKKKQLIIKLISNRGEIWLDIGLFV